MKLLTSVTTVCVLTTVTLSLTVFNERPVSSQVSTATVSPASKPGSTADPELLQLCRQLAVYYLEPEPHMALAKYFWQKGDRLQAFYLLENARRFHFPEAQFNQAFQKTFGGRRSPTESKKGEDSFKKAIELTLRRLIDKALQPDA